MATELEAGIVDISEVVTRVGVDELALVVALVLVDVPLDKLGTTCSSESELQPARISMQVAARDIRVFMVGPSKVVARLILDLPTMHK